MGLFGNLFNKKECSVCGEEIGMLGNRKLEDGNMCKNCTKLLSPWFSDRRRSTVEQIKEQLDYRDANKAKVAAFRTTRTIGDRTRVLFDEDAGAFMVTAERNLAEANPDVIPFSDVTGCDLDIKESRTELKRKDHNGNRVSYNPPRYTYRYDFNLTISVRNPYFEEIHIKLNNSSVQMETQAHQPMGIGHIVSGALRNITPESNAEYCRYKQMGEEIRDTLFRLRQNARNNAAVSASEGIKVNAQWTCPSCAGSNVRSGNFCEFCGSPRP